ncbi:HsdR family type I site-specific deoxyribonuclease [Lentilactobacillus sp. Marseille-Q4993]|uniref:type I restriction endonuclease subunit R, EcoR124 family n=1 Tax=Lentilactobacillus sp. Marseille-Q4993 TaxID=3039492 RepID=UPI0024BD17A7|nr:HsdR family type I site-specific deoxyribonuclease [Lentilactobacillus sp. Marseille-Q4993]
MEEELAMENKLINRLTQGVNQWQLREDLKTIPQLWDNFFTILAANNKEQLADAPLTANEKATIKAQMIQPSFYRAAEFMTGANRQVRIHVKRDDSTNPDADLVILNNTNVSGGTSVYQIVHQVQVPKSMALDQDRRFDVSLLINGLPVIHIELKTPKQPYMQAFHQIQKYIDEGKFSDIYCFVQMFIVTNGAMTRYISAGENLNSKFLTTWVDENNKVVENYLDFANDVLSIPAAHHMIADYTVLDSEAKNLILLRPYQIHAIQAIFEASKEGKSGFIWHTTGSGKTLTSYKVARNLLQIPSIKKTVFLIDRKDLDAQTTSAFQTYANTDTISINETSNSYDLADQLTNGDRNVVVTTRQKMQTIFKRIDEEPEGAKRYAELKNMRLAFIVDECHRTITPSQKRELDKFFNKQPLWYGFTGTPIFDQNARAENGQDARTTEQMYGPVLHSYTIEDAIRDKAVLGFKVENYGSDAQDSNDESDKKKMDEVYASDSHMMSVVENIIKLAYRKQGLMNNDRYSAIFTTSSISQAQKYYKFFKKYIKEQGVPKRIQEVAPDFPRIAITYSISQNEAESQADQSEMKESLADYNEMFGTSYTMGELDGYNRNVNDRLARKKANYKQPGAQLDIVIVVDRLLTGFDSPNLSTLYLDRRPLNPQNLIQAFSRTNRIFDKNKTWGQIITFQYPETYDKDVDEALKLYSHGGTNDILAPDWKTTRDKFASSQKKMQEYMNAGPDATSILAAPLDKRKAFAQAFQEYDKNLSAIRTFDELDNQESLPEDERIDVSEIDDESMEQMRGTYEDVLESIRQEDGSDEEELEIDDEYELTSFHTKEVDDRYIMGLIQAYVPDDENEQVTMNKKEVSEVDEYIDELAKTNSSLADIIRSLWQDVQKDPQNYSGQQLNQVLEDLIDQESKKMLSHFADEYKVDYDDLRYVMANYDSEEESQQQKGMTELMTKKAFNRFKESYPDSDLNNMLAWKKKVRGDVEDYYTNKIAPLMTRG